MKLPALPYGKSIMRPWVQVRFGGLNHNYGAGDGEPYDMANMSAREFPLLSPRVPRGLVDTLNDPNGMGALDAPYWADGTTFYYDGAAVGTVTDTEKVFAAMGTLIIIFPDKKYYDTETETFGSLEASWSGAGLSFQNGSYAGVSAQANTLYKSGADWESDFAEGDAVTISGCVTHPENNKTLIIREIDGDYLRFYEYALTLDTNWVYTADENGLEAGSYHFTPEDTALQFTLASDMSEGDTLTWNGSTLTASIGGVTSTLTVTSGSSGTALTFGTVNVDYTESGTVTLAREVPDLDYLCVNENRLWGCKGTTIYASKLGDPANFNVFDGLSTDSWASGTVDAGDFTACVSYLGYPIFFKEERIYKVYGDKPANFQWTASAELGVQAGSYKSLAVANETLFYLSRSGVCAYTGGIPTVISENLGRNTRFSGGVGGSDGLCYYLSMTDGTGYSLYVWDTRAGTWHREDGSQAAGFAFWDGGLHMLLTSGALWRLDGAEGTSEGPVAWTCEFADAVSYYETTHSGSENRKGLLRLLIRCELETGATMAVHIQYDSSGEWETVYGMTATAKKSFNVPLILRRCDHYRLKLTGTGMARVYSITGLKYAGSHLG